MKRVCLDVSSSYWHQQWFDGPNDARAYFKGKTFRFWAATTFDDSNQQFVDFTDCNELYSYLVKADEIITFNGRKCDLVVIESLVGEEAARAIWAKPHHDLTGWRMCWSLSAAIKEIVPHLASSYDSTIDERLAELGGHEELDRTPNDLAGTYRDAKFTYAVFVEYLRSGDKDRTFSDLGNLIPLKLL